MVECYSFTFCFFLYLNLKWGETMGEVIAIANQKGGVGKTMTSVSLSACLTKHKRKVLLIDLDPQGHSTKSFGYRNMNEYPLSMKDVIISVINDQPIAI